MSRRAALVRRLADGAFHSGEALARELGVTRAAVARSRSTAPVVASSATRDGCNARSNAVHHRCRVLVAAFRYGTYAVMAAAPGSMRSM